MIQLKQMIKPLVPKPLLRWRYKILSEQLDRQFSTQSTAEAFAAVYKRRLWGSDGKSDYYSGPGSHDAVLVESYVKAVADFLRTLKSKPNAVDLGCGDFNIGSKVRPLCNNYVACDVVSGLIEQNQSMFAGADVDFRVLDIATEILPDGDVVFLRQVLQHMSNVQIQQLLPKLAKYAWAIVTEHLPANSYFVANRDKPAGPTIRVNYNSGVVLEEPPFALSFHDRVELCALPSPPGMIKTVAYRLRS